MRKKIILTSIGGAIGAAILGGLVYGQDITAWVTGAGHKPALAVVDFRGTGQAQQLMSVFNSTLYGDLDGSGLFDMRPKSMYPLNNPQSPADLKASDNNQGYALSDWAGAPVNASHLVFGYAAAQNGAFALYGNLFDTRQPQSAGLISQQRYVGSLDEAGAIHAAHEFANDIIQKFGGGASLLGTRIYFVSSRGAPANDSEIWVMDWDGNNQKQLTHLGTLSLMPAISPDGSRLAFTSYPRGGTPRILMMDVLTGRMLPFYNQEASLNANASFTPDGKSIYYVSTAAGISQIFKAGITGEGFQRVSHTNAVESEPKVNPKNPNVILFTSGQSGPEQIYQMDANGLQVQRVTNGTGEAANPAWNPDGQHIAFAWTSGYAKGDFNIFIMDIGTRQYIQLTHGEGRNENPVWAPDGRHIVFARGNGKSSQIYTMLADGTQVTQLTKEGNNKTPVWGVK
jgi:TolB protein